MHLRVKPADTKQLEQICTWRYEGAYASFNYALKAGGWLDAFQKDRIYSVEEECRIVGVFFLIERNDGRWEYRILVHPQELGKGLGKRITLLALCEARRLGIDELMLLVRQDHETAHRLYRSVGFVETGMVRERVAGEPRVMCQMMKRLA
ncbi:GNAT family N-acetyltransferase [Nitratifractor sp.]|uniref:GNAT family N-acetyltransferase n=1 Tax=Nitratifractor sp. TaxID=2268144 RepID=UPI0025DD7559|nr:GNAT family N-acetyltransferase [Nitratifractor sp.]